MGSEKQLEKARAAASKKNFEYAIELYLLHLKATPDDVGARNELRVAERQQKKMAGGGGFMAKARLGKLGMQAGMIRVNSKDPEKAMIACEDLLKQDPDCVAALLKLGEAASYASLNDVAIHVFEDALSVDKDNKEALRLLGRVHEATNDLDKALKCFQRLEKIDPKDSEALDKVKKIPAKITSRGFQEGAKKGFQGLINKDEADKLERNSARVRTPEQALERISEFEAELVENPNDTKTMRLIAELYVKAEQPDQAITWCEKALEVDPNYYLASELRGDLLLKKLEDAVKQAESAYRKSTRDPAAKQAVVRARKQKLVFEIDEFRKRAEAHPTEAGLRFPLGKALYDGGKIDEAIPELQKAKGDPRKKVEAGYYLGQCFIKKKILKMAVRELEAAREEVFEMDDMKKDITYLIARIYEGAGKKDKAMTEYEKIAEVDFNYKDVTTRLEALG